MDNPIYIACDFGGGSGRVIAGWINDSGTVTLNELFRFRNRQIKLGSTLYWDFPALFQDMKDGLRMAAKKYGSRIKSIGIDTWGVDFGIIDGNGSLIGMPVCYRDSRTDGLVDAYFKSRDRYEHYAHNGTQVMEINTLFQLLAMKERGQLQVEDRGARLLFMPDLFSYYLTGVANNEYSIASTSELLNANTRQWDWELVDDAGLPRSLFGEIVMPGTSRGCILPELSEELGLSADVEVVAVASHDTASAVMSIPPFKEATAWISSGTWSLLGVCVDEPILSREACDACFTNEGGFDGKITFLSNITGLWILQQLAKEWNCNDWFKLQQMARESVCDDLIDVDSDAFMAPKSMEKAIWAAVGRELSKGETVLCVLKSLSHRYAQLTNHLCRLTHLPIKHLHIMGGGSRNILLNELTSEATGMVVTEGEVEATAIGNIICQAKTIETRRNSNA